MYAAPFTETTRPAQPKRERIASPENDPRAAIAEMMVTQAARHLRGIPINGERYGELLEAVRLSALDDSRPFSNPETLRPVRALEDRFVQTTYAMRNRTHLEAQRTKAERHVQAFKKTMDAIPDSITQADPQTATLASALSRAFVRGINDVNLADACVTAGDVSRTSSYVKSALMSVAEANTAEAQLIARLEQLTVRDDAVGETAYALLKPIDDIHISLSFINTRALDLLDRIADAGRRPSLD